MVRAMPGTANMILMPLCRQPRSEKSLQAEQQGRKRDRRRQGRYGERQVDQGDQQVFSPKFKFGNGPRADNTENKFAATEIAATNSVSRIAASVSGSPSAPKYADTPFAKAWVNTTARGSAMNMPRKSTVTEIIDTRTHVGSAARRSCAKPWRRRRRVCHAAPPSPWHSLLAAR